MPQSEIEHVIKDSIFDIVFGEFCACSDETEQVLNDIIEQVRALPAADVVPARHGNWEFIDSAPWYHKCNQCQCFLKIDDITDGKANYCPNCGAKMDGESNA